ncbi:uncharacterized protein LOC125069239 isoform X2 [Vanessa atalanta]|uniref:uncharacterized protein LOC125069239 isoform X2 n=1 Tax=Vanessa atalanta TaxID=42275 RepID=UPI001FCCCE99|nr:uncharacterized protein LOC125069239 isoform X2 [Vanessa atalanta]
MNAIVGLCHFCEAHGPRPLFCTFTTDNDTHTTESSNCAVQCSGCTSVGPETVYVSRDDDGIIFCSRESVPNADVTAFLRQAALRSITCEKIAKELQQLADIVYDNEQSICSQRALRLKTGRNDFGQSRSLTQLTGDDDIFKKLHSHFTWMLRTGAVTYSETLYTSQDLLKKLNPQMTIGTIFDESACMVTENDDSMSLRELENLLTNAVFRIILYCTLTGIDIEIKSKQTEPSKIINCLSRLLPSSNNNTGLKIRPINLVPATQSPDVCILEEMDNSNFSCKWSGTLPTKCPTLMNKIVNAMTNTKFNDVVLHQHIKSLTVEWLGIAKTIKMALQSSGKPDAVTKLKQILGVSPNDELLVNYWSQSFCCL